MLKNKSKHNSPNMKWIVASREIKFVVFKFTKGNLQAQMVSPIGEFYQIFKEKLTPFICNLFQKAEDERTLPTHFNKLILP